jgi:serine/threonine protein kinase
MIDIHDFIRHKSNERYTEISEMPQEEGGFGRLYRAVDAEHPQTEACIKVIKPNLSKDLQFKLWNEEILALGRYRKRSGIVHLVDEQYHFTSDDPYLFIVMDYVHGKRLGGSKYRVELDVEDDLALLLIFQLCSVMVSIHQRGDYHQDIFPDNIKIRNSDLILLDLGGMREAERRSGTIIFGGEMYSPPEVSPTRLRMKRFRTLRKQRMGSFETADIFSIGALFYELLMGVPFFESVEQSNQLKEFIYDYYSDPNMLRRMKREYKEALETAKRNREKFYNFLRQYPLPPLLCERGALTLSVHPQKRPAVDDLLDAFFPYLLQRATEAYRQQEWEQAQHWVRHLERHFDEIRLEIQDEDEFLRQTMTNHLVTHFAAYVQSSLIMGSAQFQQGNVNAAQQTFIKMKEELERYESECAGPQWNGYLLKVTNNLAACHYKRRQSTDALHLWKSLSTAPGEFGQIINRNLQVCQA